MTAQRWPLGPDATIGILGGGQLGRMLAMAAARLGLQSCIYNDTQDAPAFQVTQHCVVAPYDDLVQLGAFADACDAVTFEFENLPAHAIVLSVDEKSQIQALDRTQPGLPLKKSR